MDTWTAERTFAKVLIEAICSANHKPNIPIVMRIAFTSFFQLRAAIHSAVHVFMGEADEIAAQSLCGFCG
jgi:hypothetical protein